MKFGDKLKKYRESKQLSAIEIANKLNISEEDVISIENGTKELSKEEQESILDTLGIKFKFTSKRVIKIMDLLFRCGAMIMALVTLLLCVYGNITPNTLIALLSIGLVCSSLTMLPKIEK